MKSSAEELEEIAQPLMAPNGSVVKYVPFDELIALMKRREDEILREARRAEQQKKPMPPLGSW